ncbi:nuclear transport factor 2 family protein [Herbidospora sp. NBRC 101105]|uniref:nuclear transport factor 2 family protein n=1 Tax=Herbidospora sp. NBRC 101105 TaxID=3032195 RepID=UPI002552DF1E|nr:nuclear transport factor 2 family protein [Herbidospora sp. NBRC 101105]
MKRLVIGVLTATLLTGCSGDEQPSAAIPATTTPATTAPAAVAPELREVVDRFVKTINAGDAQGVGAMFAEAARFDSVGRIYSGRAEIMDRFLVPEVIEAGGRYTLLDLAPNGDRVVARYDFTTGSGGEERFTYDCAVAGGAFTDCVGRYVS